MPIVTHRRRTVIGRKPWARKPLPSLESVAISYSVDVGEDRADANTRSRNAICAGVKGASLGEGQASRATFMARLTRAWISLFSG